MTNQKLSPAKFTLLGFQHMFAMFGATVLVPTLTGLSVSATLLFAGLGTLLFHLITGGKVPAFLGSSFAFLGGYAAVKAMPQFADGTMNWIPYAGVGVAVAGLIYVVVAGLFKIFGAQKVMRFFPPIVTGPIIICIGMILANSAINNCSNNWLIAILAVVIVVAFNIWGKGMFKIIPILLGVVGSYAVAAVTGQVDFTPVKEAAWLGLPFQWKDTAFSLFGGCDGTLLLNCIITVAPIALATMMEHIGDMSAISSTVGKNFIEDPGLHRSLLGDGLATTMAALFGAPANTTYGENTGVLALTRVYNPAVVRMAAVLAGHTHTCVISFIDLYEKVRRNFPQVQGVSRTDRLTLGKAFVEIGRQYGLTIRPCAEGDELAPYGADCSGCMTQQIFETALHRRLHLPPGKNSRKECACFMTADIGAYNTCGHLCRYCYANYSKELVTQNMRQHDPQSPFLIGHSLPGDVIHQAQQKSWMENQLSLFDLL